jgi:hypothetical protein
VTQDLTAGLSQHGTELAGCIQVGGILTWSSLLEIVRWY